MSRTNDWSVAGVVVASNGSSEFAVQLKSEEYICNVWRKGDSHLNVRYVELSHVPGFDPPIVPSFTNARCTLTLTKNRNAV
jgi:hypothetical protein